MEYKINTISTKKNVFIALSWIFLGYFLFGLYVVNNKKADINFLTVAFVIIFMLISGYFISRFFSTKATVLKLTEDTLLFENYSIQLKRIQGFLISREGTRLIQLEIRTSDRDYQINASSNGTSGQEFEKFLLDFEYSATTSNSDIKKLGFYDFHTTFYSIQKKLVPALGIVLIGLHLIYFYSLFIGKMHFNPKIILVDFMYLVMFVSHKNKMNQKLSDENKD